ncbi:hypothetical protein D3C72_2327600 [compost metagenome]
MSGFKSSVDAKVRFAAAPVEDAAFFTAGALSDWPNIMSFSTRVGSRHEDLGKGFFGTSFSAIGRRSGLRSFI